MEKEIDINKIRKLVKEVRNKISEVDFLLSFVGIFTPKLSPDTSQDEKSIKRAQTTPKGYISVNGFINKYKMNRNPRFILSLIKRMPEFLRSRAIKVGNSVFFDPKIIFEYMEGEHNETTQNINAYKKMCRFSRAARNMAEKARKAE